MRDVLLYIGVSLDGYIADREGRVDELWLTVVPRVLGGGVPLFPGEEGRRALRLISGGRCGDTLLCRYRVE